MVYVDCIGNCFTERMHWIGFNEGTHYEWFYFWNLFGMDLLKENIGSGFTVRIDRNGFHIECSRNEGIHWKQFY